MSELFKVVAADPPWSFNDKGTRMAPEYAGKQREASHYGTLKIDEIAALMEMQITGRIADNAFLFLWAPNAMVLDGSASWVSLRLGFAPKQLITWVKVDKVGQPRFGGGHYTRVATEQLVLATRGKPKVLSKAIAGVIHAPRTEHSAKPDASYELIESLCEGPFLELFARRRFSEKWSVWGNEVS